MIAQIVWGALAGVWILDGLRLRARAAKLRPVAGRRDQIVVGAATGGEAATELPMTDLVPRDLPTWRALVLLNDVDPKNETNRFAKGRSAGHALAVDREIVARAGEPPADPIAAAIRYRPYATRAGFAVVPPANETLVDGPVRRRELLHRGAGDLDVAILVLQAIVAGLALAGPLVTRAAGIAALAAYQLQPLLVFAGTALRPRDLFWQVIARAPIDIVNAFRVVLARPAHDPVEARRAHYDEALARRDLVEPRRTDCPICGSRDLELELVTDDLLQRKPGEFTLERCLACRHVFQNPRLSIAGLNYYYGDFYDGLGDDGLEAIFGYSRDPYLARARIVDGLGDAPPKTWLDVGAGHGHFCAAARDVWPAARFDGLDLSASVDEAVRRGWMDRAYRGLFPDVAPSIEGAYDVVSMSHYLEHTRDPRAELAAARTALKPGGLLFIEVPDPDCKTRVLLGRWWLPWFQPQHQHFVSTKNLALLLEEQGFEPVRWHRGEAHQAVDLTLALMLLLGPLVQADAPWRDRSLPGGRVAGSLLWWATAPILGLGVLVDRLAAPILRRPGWSNTYRVVARLKHP
jgi:SAM-dependent methyltransferase